MVKIKICGLSRNCDIDAVNIERPEYIGFVFARSRRRVTPKQALDLRKKLHHGIIPVGVFVDDTLENILSLVKNGIIEVIQLHGLEDEEYISRLKMSTDVPIIKAVAVQSESDLQKWLGTSSDYLLLDSIGGGTGNRFDWNFIGKIDKPFFLAGGLNPENVAQAIKDTTPFAVDVSSGVETDGLKDPLKIKEFIRSVRNA
ncbi:MAG: phosphoribosylanthranilate isomerase [Oscillospiraceae bacterium]|nr:phosphoribosylanthranilate isomerase [Oscillospiraceae bacterium]